MNPRSVFHLVAFLLIFLGLAMGLCWVIAMIMGDPAAAQRGLAWSFAIVTVFGFALWTFTRTTAELSLRDGIGVVTFGWLMSSLAGALPFMLTGVAPRFIDGLFETVSGLTTTGASILSDPDTAPKGILFWRALTHFFGGMGILVFCVAILPLLGTGGTQIYRAETSGATRERLTPRIASTAKLLWGIYMLMNIVLIALLGLGGMPWFDSVCHAFATVATGGFSTRTLSIAAYHSLYIEVVLAVFMFLSAVNFTLHYRALHGAPLNYFRNAEFRFYLGFCTGVALLIAISLWVAGYPSFGAALRAAFFATTSILSTTGFCTDDFDAWPALAKTLLLLSMLVGGCAGSTTGGFKQVRLLVTLKRIAREVWLFIHPQAVVQVRLGRAPIDAAAAAGISTFVLLFLVTFAAAGAAMTCFTDVETAFSSTAAALGNVGPGYGGAGALETYADFPTGAKGILIACMLLGRLEFYTLLVVLLPRFWRK